MTAPLVNSQAEFHPGANEGKIRDVRYALRDAVARFLPHERVARCGKHPYAGTVEVKKSGTGASYFSGVETCSSVWMCPVCTRRIAEVRRQEVEALNSAHLVSGGSIAMTAFTMPHYAWSNVKDLREGIAKGWQRTLAGKAWQQTRDRFGIDGYVRALEVTHGKNGWHPHLHVLFYFKKPLSEEKLAELESWLFIRWANRVRALGFGECNRDIFRLEDVENSRAAGDYVTKWGADAELTYAHLKTAKNGSESPWQILARAARGDKRAKKLFQHYALSFKGARHLTFSKGLRDRYGLNEPLSDDEAANVEQGDEELVIVLQASEFREIRNAGLLISLLNACDKGSHEALAWVERFHARRRRRHRCVCRTSSTHPPNHSRYSEHPPGPTTGRIIPFYNKFLTETH